MEPHRDVLYCEGPGDIVAAYEAWKNGTSFLGETGVTFSSQLFDACKAEGLTLFAASSGSRKALITDPLCTVANIPRWNLRLPKVGYEISLLAHTLRLAILALRIRPRIILVAGSIEPACATILRISGAKVVPVLHNTLWPEGFPPQGLKAQLYRWGERILWACHASSTLAVSQAAARQARSLGARNVTVFKPSFPGSSFAQPPEAKDFRDRPFRIMFAGRIEANKGVYDILDIAERLGSEVEFTLCGGGSQLDHLNQAITRRGLGHIVRTCGKLDRPQLLTQYLAAHAVIVPTKSTFAEGFAMVVAEAILLQRPVITSPVVPASESLAGAIALVRTDDIDGYVAAINTLCNDEAYYDRLVLGARELRSTILDDSTSFLATVRATLHALVPPPRGAVESPPRM